MHYLAQREWGQTAEVGSAGTHAEIGMDIPPATRRAALEHGLAIPRHRPTQLNSELLARADLVLVATERHAQWIERTERGLPDHVFVFKEAVELATRAPRPGRGLLDAASSLHAQRLSQPAPRRSLDDPWGRSQATFDRVMGEIAEGIAVLTDWIGHGAMDDAVAGA